MQNLNILHNGYSLAGWCVPYLIEIFEAQRGTLYDQSTENTGGMIFVIYFCIYKGT